MAQCSALIRVPLYKLSNVLKVRYRNKMPVNRRNINPATRFFVQLRFVLLLYSRHLRFRSTLLFCLCTQARVFSTFCRCRLTRTVAAALGLINSEFKKKRRLTPSSQPPIKILSERFILVFSRNFSISLKSFLLTKTSTWILFLKWKQNFRWSRSCGNLTTGSWNTWRNYDFVG